MRRRRNLLIAGLLTLFASLGALVFVPGARVAAEDLPARISDAEFWRMVSDFSEPGGYFRSDNLISNENTFQQVIPELRKRTKPGGVYLGVGPDQNFTYIVALRPKIAFVVDIRRQNMLLHLLYKALIELSGDRADLLSRLFSRPRPPGVGPKSSAQALFDAYNNVASSNTLFQKNLRAVADRLVTHHGFELTSDDLKSIDYVYSAFYVGGPDIRYSFPSQYGWQRFPSYAELILETDLQGQMHSYLATEENFSILKELENKNLLVPLVGNFAGDKAIRSVGRYLKEHGATVTGFYTSNVEFYLFQSDDWKKFYSNVATLPLDETSTFIRAYTNRFGFWYQGQNPGARMSTLLDPIAGLVSAFTQGRIQTYADLIERSK